MGKLRDTKNAVFTREIGVEMLYVSGANKPAEERIKTYLPNSLVVTGTPIIWNIFFFLCFYFLSVHSDARAGI